MNSVKSWIKIGNKSVLAEGRSGKRLISQLFKNPASGQLIDYTLFDADFISVIIFPLTTNGEVIAVRQFRMGIDRVSLELPGGNKKVEDKNFIETAERELREETGYKAGQIIPLADKLWIDPSSCTPYLYSFLALECKRTEKTEEDANEIIETVTMPQSKWIDMISGGKISDMKTIAITLLAISHLSDKLIIST
ncbi:MAG: hypothetical protein A2915_03155 [Candidatus Yanofskybacteria bacterium RIFCSPLOWO2_01_FULL_41_34]|uniref:Nudix hydrolase domain-containing protein n=1 Tax=Candidatus Yanofskybacteria bacterium RIFCSPHIGHO2_01_FULL_41_26 TaxID=1802661 RepID=A0A1F8EDI0_9BACT|nr:MAG: hypothetical protein A2649_01050 [Candidatus Yanofskybacteria bacterium RIFCSPHIGHO2_01_FULL_41_26]OGN21032.1 MAG: hypothetical protein A2915_03155 [Candidatus Yanofskybacteria bacterium RIFCSPLOWO2_01_FULL_41_34]